MAVRLHPMLLIRCTVMPSFVASRSHAFSRQCNDANLPVAVKDAHGALHLQPISMSPNAYTPVGIRID